MENFHENYDLESVIHKLASKVYNWNNYRKYSLIGSNCHDFINDILKEIKVNLDFSKYPVIGGFIKDLRSMNEPKLKISISENFQKTFNLKEKFVFFETHEELDKFIHGIFHGKDYEVVVEWKKSEEFVLFKALDRAFWFKHLNNDDNDEKQEKFIPWKEEGISLNCFFDDPRGTGSYGTYYDNIIQMIK